MVELTSLEKKEDLLRENLLALGGVVVALSGGVDSCYLAAAASRWLGEKALAVTALSETFPSWDREGAEALAKTLGLRHRYMETSELSIPGFTSNPRDRCYHCKRELFSKLKAIAESEGLPHVVDGTTADDLDDYRPGRRAAAELGVRSPLLDAGLTKDEVRELSSRMGIPGHARPASACLASRFPYGSPITEESLTRVERGELLMRSLGFEMVRVRSEGATARIEIEPGRLADAIAQRDAIVSGLRGAGFVHVALDLAGYRTGSMNET